MPPETPATPRVLVLHHGPAAHTEARVVPPLRALAEQGALRLTVRPYVDPDRGLREACDTLVLVDVQDGATAMLADARRMGARVLYFTSDAAATGDIYALSGRARVMARCDAVVRDPRELPRAVRDTSAAAPVTTAAGKRILFVEPTFMWPHQAIGQVLARNLVEMGHEVHVFTPAPSRFVQSLIGRPRDLPSDLVLRAEAQIGEPWELPLLVDRGGFDLVLTVQGYVLPRQVLSELHRRRVPTAVWLMDEPYDASRSAAWARCFSHVFVQDSAALPLHRRDGNPNVFYLPHGGDPDGVHAAPAAPEPFEHDVTLVGSPFPHRIALVERLLRAGMQVTAVGSAWRRSALADDPRLRVLDNLGLAEAAAVYRRSRVNLNVHRGADDHASAGAVTAPEAPNCSAFYIAASGGYQLCDAGRARLGEHFTPGEHLALFDGAEDCVRKVRRALDDPEARARTVAAASARVRASESYRHRLDALLRTVQEVPGHWGDDGYRRIAWIRLGEAPAPGVAPSERGQIVELVPAAAEAAGDGHYRVAPLVPGGPHRRIELAAEAGFGRAVETAIFESAADYLVVGAPEVHAQASRLEPLLARFSADLGLGLIELRRPDDDRACGFIAPMRSIERAGALGYGSAELALAQLRNTILASDGLVEDASCDAPPLDACTFHREDAADGARFRARWTDDADARITAERIMRLRAGYAAALAPEQAEAMGEAALALSPTLDSAAVAVARSLIERGRVFEARERLQRAWDGDPSSAALGLSLAAALSMVREHDAASAILDQVFSRRCSRVEEASAWYQKGRSLHGRGDAPDESSRCLRRALAIDPSHAGAALLLADLVRTREGVDAAVALLHERAARLGTAEAHISIGSFCWQIGERERAWAWFRDLVLAHPEWRDSALQLARMSCALRRYQEGREVLERVLRFHPYDEELAQARAQLYVEATAGEGASAA